MCSFSEEEIKKYLDILHKYKKSQKEKAGEESEESEAGEAGEEDKNKCSYCRKNKGYSIYSGYKICDNCGCQNGHVLGYFDYKDNDRLIFRKKSIYQRKYHYEKKVNQVSRRLQLTDKQKCDLYLDINKLMAIDNNVMEILNKQFKRKRMISIFYLIKKNTGRNGK